MKKNITYLIAVILLFTTGVVNATDNTEQEIRKNRKSVLTIKPTTNYLDNNIKFILNNAPNKHNNIMFKVVNKVWGSHKLKLFQKVDKDKVLLADPIIVYINENDNDRYFFMDSDIRENIKPSSWHVMEIIEIISRYTKAVIVAELHKEFETDEEYDNLSIDRTRKTLSNMGFSSKDLAKYSSAIEIYSRFTDEDLNAFD